MHCCVHYLCVTAYLCVDDYGSAKHRRDNIYENSVFACVCAGNSIDGTVIRWRPNTLSANRMCCDRCDKRHYVITRALC